MPRNAQKGNVLVEFALISIPVVMLLVSIVQLGLVLWSYHTVAYAVREAVRYASMRGPGCAYSGNSCGTTLGTIAKKIVSSGVGLDSNGLQVTFASSAGSTTCTPLSTCTGTTTSWPPASVAVGSRLSISATYPYSMFFMPLIGGGPIINSGSLRVVATARVLF